VHYRGEVVASRGCTWQAIEDTGTAPPHGHWIQLAACGVDGSTPTVRGTWQAGDRYARLDIVALDGGSFIARVDDPGECPGPDWQLVAKQGKGGKPGDRGPRGEPGPQGARGIDGLDAPLIVDWAVDHAAFSAVPLFADGTHGPPLNLRGLFDQYHDEARRG
jgi:hypothetical protein